MRRKDTQLQSSVSRQAVTLLAGTSTTGPLLGPLGWEERSRESALGELAREPVELRGTHHLERPFSTLSSNQPDATLPSSALHPHDLDLIDEPHDYHDSTPTAAFQQRQQRQQPPPSRTRQTSRPVSPSGTGTGSRTLRRSPRLEEHRSARPRSASAGSSQRPERAPPLPQTRQQIERAFSDDLNSSSTSRFSAGFRHRSSSQPARETPRRRRISRRTASAILYALEEAVRTPNLFTPDLIEEEASMSDLTGGGSSNPVGSNARAPTTNGGYKTAGPVPGPPRYQATGVRTPSDIMRAREAKKRENEARARERDDEENQRRVQEQRRRSYDNRRAAAAGAAGGGGAPDAAQRRSSGAATDPSQRRSSGAAAAAADPSQRRSGGTAVADPSQRRSGGTAQPGPGVAAVQSQNPERRPVIPAADRPDEIAPLQSRTGAANRAPAPGPSQSRGASSQYQPRTTQASNPSQAARAPQTQTGQPSTVPVTGTGPTTQAQAGPSVPPSASQPTQAAQPEGGQPRNPNASSFPHAFERWEMLSSHWEGLTGHWIRRLEQNSDEVRREPLAQQMSRQITDLSAAGANLFHAVVELQRLRASSERKFQRWFFETRAEQERARELQGEIENSLRQERKQRGDALQGAQRAIQEKENADKMVGEMRRELQISREEARRAWEELGRMENLERERMSSLRDGRPTLVGKIQVVPTVPGGPSRHGSINPPPAREEQQSGPDDGRAPSAGLFDPENPAQMSYETEPGYRRYAEDAPSTNDPFLEPAPQPPIFHAPEVPQPSTTNGISAGGSTRTTNPSTSQRGTPPTRSAVTTTTALSSHGPGSQPSATQPTSASPSFYQHEGQAIQGPGQIGVVEGDDRSFISHPSDDGTLGEVEYMRDERGEYTRDPEGRRVAYPRGPRSEESDEYDVEEELARERAHRDRYGGDVGSGTSYGPASSSAMPSRGGVVTGGWSEQPVDYSGSGWDMEIRRHHHPTRLSDVLEEDERSRTSQSRASMSSRR
ncbi:MAG: hypothetical protein M1837_000812 [Sclerophora amabilis]|nr:MAG: hypothetical protein M1837_000812 [Sclerophora amabilis]